ncbi:hypothetical protein [Bradyrhizobium centrolobii]|uniref:hypothetical protein n=1 Tax=Bradyrhizobium centrolobii TaxID=1505087 RepID=UPI000A7B7E9C
MPDINPVDWNVEEFRRLLDEPLRSTRETALPYEVFHLASDDRRQRLTAIDDPFLPEETGEQTPLPPTADNDPARDRSIVEVQSPAGLNLEPGGKSEGAVQDQALHSTKAVLVLNIEMASKAKVDIATERATSTQVDIANVPSEPVDVDLMMVGEATVASPGGSLPGDAERRHAPRDEVRGAFLGEPSALGDVPVSYMPMFTVRHPQPCKAESGTSSQIAMSDGSPIPPSDKQPSPENNETSDQPSVEVHVPTDFDLEPETSVASLGADQALLIAISVLDARAAPATGNDAASETLNSPEPEAAELSVAAFAPDDASLTRTVEIAEAPDCGLEAVDTSTASTPIASVNFVPSLEANAAKLASLNLRHLTPDDRPPLRSDQPFVEGETANAKLALRSEPTIQCASQAQAPEVVTVDGKLSAMTGRNQLPPGSVFADPQPASAPPIGKATEDAQTVIVELKPDRARQATARASSTSLRNIDDRKGSATLAFSPKSPLLKAIVEPDIWTAPVDRERAIALRWALRDIRANRLAMLPIDPLTLQTLVELNLVEVSDGKPILTSAGLDAVAST